MFGIGFGELMVIAVVILIAVGPRRLPTLMKSVGRAMREFRKATRELRAQVGLDEIMNDEDLRNPLPDLRRIIDEPLPRVRPKKAGGAELEDDVPAEEVAAPPRREYPEEGVDVAEADRSRDSRSG